jgi:hypothetical protein
MSTSTPLRDEADRVLFEKGLLALLQKYGEPHVSGSYALDLMVWRDLDVYLQAEAMSERRFFELGGRIAELLAPSRMHFRNERIGQTVGLPHGLYWGVYFEVAESRLWKLDIWCVPGEECRRLLAHCENIQARVTPATREIILVIKSACWQHPEYRSGFSSQDIYTAVLEDGISTLDAFREYLSRTKGISV